MLNSSSLLSQHLQAVAQWHGSACPNCFCGRMFYTGFESRIQEHFENWERYGIVFDEDLKHSFLGIPETFLYQCGACGLGRFYPVIEGTSAYYAAIATSDYYVGYRPEFDLARSALRGRSGALLEIGSGRGDFLRFLRQKGSRHELHALDSNPAVHIELKKLAITHGSSSSVVPNMDAVCAFQVLEHMGDPFSFVDWCKLILRPGGLILISVPDYDGFIRFYGESHTETPPHHLTRWNRSSLNALLVKRGFTVLCNKGIPLQKKMLNQYAGPLYYHFLSKLKLERDEQYAEGSKKFEAFLQQLPFKSIPFTSFDRFICARYDGQ